MDAEKKTLGVVFDTREGEKSEIEGRRMMKSARCVKLLIIPLTEKAHTVPLRASQSLCVVLWVCV